MKINFTKKEYRKLVELLYLGDWMLHSHDVQANPETRAHRELRDKIFAQAGQMGCENIIARHAGGYFETREFEDFMQGYVQNYDNQTFWQELIARLAERDATRQAKAQGNESMDRDELFDLIDAAEQRWGEELAQHALERIAIVPDRQI